MTDFFYLLFNQSPEQMRRIGARGGKAQARNRRARLLTHNEALPCRAVVHPLPEHPLPEHPLPQTATQAIAGLDAQFPWLCGAEKRQPPRRLQRNRSSFISIPLDSTAHLEDHAEWLRRIQTPPPANGSQLWNQRASLFPSLEFCDSVEDQVTRKALRAGNLWEDPK